MATMVTLICEQCGKEFSVIPSCTNTARFCSVGCANKSRTIPVEQRFFQWVGPADRTRPRVLGAYCRLWLRAVNSCGYGYIYRNGRSEHVHRVAWELYHGKPVPKGMQINHHCDNPTCVNPKHLYLGTPADNTRDMVRRGRQSKGEKQGSSKLTWKQVREIRGCYAKGGVTQRQLAEEYSVSLSAISLIIRRETWRHHGRCSVEMEGL